MAGSRKWFVYDSDSGAQYAIQLDESNTEAVMGGDVGDYTDTSDVVVAVPRNITPRKVSYSNNDRTRVIVCTVLTTSRYTEIVDGTEAQTIPDPIDGGTLFLIRAAGERITLPFAIDTGLTDGDAT